jgi:purine-binding chemotaxis protein CheW
VVSTAAARDDRDRTVLRCRVADHDFAIPVDEVAAVHRAVAVTTLPGAPEAVTGVVEVHGELVPVVDLGARIGLAPRAVTLSDAFVMVAVGNRPVLLVVDAATDVTDLSGDRIQDAETLVPGSRYLRDVAGTSTGPLVIHDLDAFLSSADLAQLDHALTQLRTSPQGGKG